MNMASGRRGWLRPEATGIQFESITDKIDTTTRCFFTILAAISQMERDLIRERTNAGLKAARARGRFGGRKPKLSKAQEATVRQLMSDPATNVSETRRSIRGQSQDALSHS